MKRLLWILLLALVALAVLLWQLPASIAIALLPAQASQVLRVHAVDGTVWQGSARLSVSQVPPVLSLRWSCRPRVLPLGLDCTLADALSGELRAALLDRSLSARQLSLTLPVQIEAAGQSLGGSPRIELKVDELALAADRLAVKAVARADDARWRLGQNELRLGELSVDCAPAADRISSTCTLSNRGAEARLDGKAALTAQRLSGSVELAAPNAPPQRFAF